MAGGAVDEQRVGSAVDALLRWVSGAKDQHRIRLLDDEQLLYLVVSLKKIPDKARVNPFKIPIPHPLLELDGTLEICLIVNDLSRGILRKEAKQRVIEEGLRVSKVIGISKLKKDYKTSESKRKLCGSYDLFLVDRRVLPILPKVLGKVFFRKKKTPIPIDLTRSQWKSQFETICNSTFMFLSTGSCSVVKVAKVSQTREEIVENVMAVIQGVAAAVPRKWENILALHLKALESLALPIYQSNPTFPVKIDVNMSKKDGNVTRVKLLPEADDEEPALGKQLEPTEPKKMLKKKTKKTGETSAVVVKGRKKLGSKPQ